MKKLINKGKNALMYTIQTTKGLQHVVLAAGEVKEVAQDIAAHFLKFKQVEEYATPADVTKATKEQAQELGNKIKSLMQTIKDLKAENTKLKEQLGIGKKAKITNKKGK